MMPGMIEGTSPGASLLAATGLVGGYGGNDILNGLDLAVTAGEIAVIVGPNGAGKSTAMKAIFGMVRLRQGRVRFADADITGEPPERLVRRGMAYVPQERNVFRHLSVEENLAGCCSWPGRGCRRSRSAFRSR